MSNIKTVKKTSCDLQLKDGHVVFTKVPFKHSYMQNQ